MKKNVLFLSILFLISSFFIACDNKDVMPDVELNTVDDSDLENMDCRQLTKLMGNGINLGNTFEAVNTSLGHNASISSYETAWEQPETTQAIIKAYKSAGFSTLRIPVAWTNTMDWENDDYTISSAYLARVGTVINWAIDEGMYVIVNDHWDNGWWGLFGSNKTKAYKIFDEIWKQVGEYYKSYDYHLIFEAGNEEWGERFNDTVNGVHGNLSSTQQYSYLNELSQHFVDLIRAQGGNNAKRFLLIPGFDTNIGKTISSNYEMPSDASNSVPKLLISVHYYDPSTYTILSEDASWGTCKNNWGSKDEVNSLKKSIARMSKFYKAGYGVIIGEYGVSKKKNSDGSYSKKKGMETWMTSILDVCDEENFCPVLWDCNTFFYKTAPYGFRDSEIAAVYANR